MKVEPVLSPQAVRSRLLTLIDSCQSFSLASAWVTGSAVFDAAIAAKAKLRRFVIGTHGYYTCADCLATCVRLPQAKVVKPNTKMFHPKLYVFEDAKRVVVYVGSSNFTRAGLENNIECGVFLSAEAGHPKLRQFLSFIESRWDKASKLDPGFVADYRANQQRVRGAHKDLEQFTPRAKPRPTNKSANDVDPGEMEWKQFVRLVKAEKAHAGPKPRLKVLARARQLFARGKPFARLPELERRCLAGVQKPSMQPDGIDWGLFGQMSAYTRFSGILRDHVDAFSAALDHIPLVGTVRQEHYDRYVQTLMSIPDAGNWIGMGTRLLAMKRPDRFVCLNKANAPGLCGYFGTAPTTTNLDNYWERIVAQMQLMPWWQADMPSDALGQQVWLGRAAMLDAIFYDPSLRRR